MPADGARPTAPKSSAMLLLDQIEKRMGKGETFAPRDRKLILAGIPAWLVYAARTAPTDAQKQQCQRMIEGLTALRESCARYLPEAFAGAKEDG